MDELHDDISKELTNAFNGVKMKIKSRIEIAKITKDYEEGILTKARKLANEYRDTSLSDEKLKEIFDKEWDKWLSEIKSISDPKFIDSAILEKAVRDSCNRQDSKKITAIFSTKQQNHTHNFVTSEDLTSSVVGHIMGLFKADSKHTRLDKAKDLTNKIRQDLAKEISNHGNDGKTYSKQFGLRLFRKIHDTLKENTDKCRLKEDKVIGIAIHIFISLLPEFNQIQDKYRRETDPRTHMANQKDKFWNPFKNECKMETMVIKIASSITNELESAIKTSLPRHCITRVIEHMPSIQAFANKMSFHTQVLIDLAEMGRFDVYQPYLTNPFECMKEHINKYIKDMCCSKVKCTASGYSVLENIYQKLLQDMFVKIETGVNATCQQEGKCNLNIWWETFSENIPSNLVVSKQLMCLNEDEYENCDFDIKDLKEKLLAELKHSENKLTKAFKTTVSLNEIVDQCQEFFEKDLLGCEELCPFCKAPCDLQTGNDEHRTSYHRPQGVKGYTYEPTKKLVIELCTTNVGSDLSFSCEDTNGKWKPFREFQEVNDRYKSWKIQPMVGEPQLYWKWFMKTYNQQLAEYYEVQPANIPEGWEDISWESAKEDMMKTYNL